MSLSARRFFLGLLLGTLVVLSLIVFQLGVGLLLATVVAVILWPVQQWLTRWLRGKRGIAAAMLVTAVVLLVMAPLVAMSAVLVRDVIEGLRYVSSTIESDGMVGLIERLPGPLERVAMSVLRWLPKNPGASLEEALNQQLGQQGGAAAAAVGSAIAATGTAVFQTVIMVIALFFFLERGDACLAWLDGASPLKKGQTRELLKEFRKTSYSVFTASFATGAVQTAVALVGFIIARVPNIIFFAGLTFVFSMIPTVGAGGVVLVTALLTLLTGHSWMALFLALWGLLVVGLVDNITRPLFMKGHAELSGAVVFFALLGGLAAFGAIGLIIGPLTVALFLALLRIYHRDIEQRPAEPLPQPVGPPRPLAEPGIGAPGGAAH